jgi:hypothetical protein
MRTQLKLKFQNKDNGAHIFTSIKIFKKTFIALIDTGATSTAFDVDFAKEHLGDQHVQLLENKAGGLGDADMVMFAADIKFHLGARKYDQTVALIDFSHIHHLYELHGLKKFHFIIGNDILINSKAIINYKTKTMSIELEKVKAKK